MMPMKAKDVSLKLESESVQVYPPVPLMKLLAVNSTLVVTTTLVEFGPFHMRQVLVLTLNALPLGTSRVRVVVMLDT